MAGQKPGLQRVCFETGRGQVTKTRALQGAAWQGEKGQLNVKLEVSHKLLSAFLEDGYSSCSFREKTAGIRISIKLRN